MSASGSLLRARAHPDFRALVPEVLAIARRTRTLLLARGFRVAMTREGPGYRGGNRRHRIEVGAFEGAREVAPGDGVNGEFAVAARAVVEEDAAVDPGGHAVMPGL